VVFLMIQTLSCKRGPLLAKWSVVHSSAQLPAPSPRLSWCVSWIRRIALQHASAAIIPMTTAKSMLGLGSDWKLKVSPNKNTKRRGFQSGGAYRRLVAADLSLTVSATGREVSVPIL
jgi:hypothetical protein